MPGVSELDGAFPLQGAGLQFAARTHRAEGEKRPRRDERIPRVWKIEGGAEQQHDPRLVADLLEQRLGRARRFGFAYPGTHFRSAVVRSAVGQVKCAACGRNPPRTSTS